MEKKTKEKEFYFIFWYIYYICLFFRRINLRGVLGEHENICKSRTGGKWFTNSLSVLPTSQVVFFAGKPMASAALN